MFAIWCACFAAMGDEPWTLERVLDYALVHDPDSRIAEQRIAASRAGLEQADAAFWPQLQFQSSYSRTDNPMMTFGDILNQRAYDPSLNFNNVPNVDDLNIQGTVTVPLYAGGQNRAQREAAKADMEAATHNNLAIRSEVSFQVVSTFQTVLKTRQFVLATEAGVNAFEHNLAIAKKRFATGTLLKSDVLDIEVQLGQARENLIRARNAHTLAIMALRDLLGIEGGEFSIADSAPDVSAPVSSDFSDRPEMAAARDREYAAEAELRGAKSGYQPRVSAFGTLDRDYGWVTGGHDDNYSAGIILRWNLWDGFLTRGKTREAAANLETARENRLKLRLAIDFEVEQARLDLDTANQELVVTKKSVEQAAESARLTRDRFEQGLAISTRMIDAETTLTAARVHYAEAEADQHIAVAALRQALGLPQLNTAK